MKATEITRSLLEQQPVWSFDEDQEQYCPVGTEEILPEDAVPLFVKASFTTPDGRHFDGYVVTSGSVYNVELFLGEHAFGFNRSLQSLARRELELLRDELRDPKLEVFPLRYETGFRFPGERLLAGTFDPFR
jgi:hypothetical protein